ncbi:MAG TPA: hypothetical protein VGP13_03320, partial [Candidatus Paceibacterota bacterium]|jgi:hypothetical protein|nr:hypothetical protein [Candidatus Paceibacterota bacterium]
MKQSRGFAWLPILIMMGIVLVLGGGAYVATQQKAPEKTPIYQQATTTLTNPPATQASQNTKATVQESATLNPVGSLSAGSFTLSGKVINTLNLQIVLIPISYAGSTNYSAVFGTDSNLPANFVAVREENISITTATNSWSAPITGVSDGQYKVAFYDPSNKTLIGMSNPITVSVSATMAVPGMSKYTDTEFGFSFWYPSEWTVSRYGSTGGGQITQLYTLTDPSNRKIADINEAPTTYLDRWINSSTMERFYFDKETHTWMQDIIGTASSSADVSVNTMGGLHMLSWSFVPATKSLIVPLAASRFIDVESANGTNITLLAKTIMATDPSVATPISQAQQQATIQAEKDAYAKL